MHEDVGAEILQEHEEEEAIDPKQVALDDPVTGVEVALLDEHGPGGIEPNAITPLGEMTSSQMAKHNLTHLPVHPGRAICRMCKTPVMSHLPSNEHARVIPLLVGEYCLLRLVQDAAIQRVRVVRRYPYTMFVACAVPKKGIDDLVIPKLARFIEDMGRVHVAYRNGRVASRNSMVEEACARSGRTGTPVDNDTRRRTFLIPWPAQKATRPMLLKSLLHMPKRPMLQSPGLSPQQSRS